MVMGSTIGPMAATSRDSSETDSGRAGASGRGGWARLISTRATIKMTRRLALGGFNGHLGIGIKGNIKGT